MTAREALLRWARRSTARYPGVRVTDFTGSWRDGLAFSALIHRNRPDLVDWRNARASQPRERLDRVFNVAEREYGVTRLLDPEGNNNDNRRPSRPSRRPSFPSPLLLRCSLPPPPLPPAFSALHSCVCIYVLYTPVSARRHFDRDASLSFFILFFFPFPPFFLFFNT